MPEIRRLELLSPARDSGIARSAILCGADSIYIGPARFGARAGAGNSVDDIAGVCAFAKIYGAKVYATVNTLLTDSELPLAEKLLWELYEAGVSAFIIQDLGILKLRLPPLPIHASTQCHVDTPDKARFLEACGFDTIVLARELTIDEIYAIRKAVSCRLECFVHGALCASFSGQCYMSLALGGRSGNRGECAQPCRMKYELVDADGAQVAPPAHYLSLKDMNRIDSLGELIDAGVDIFKIEGRLKDSAYVKNITAAYRSALDIQISSRPNVSRASFGKSSIPFVPNPGKTFNRGYCESRLHDVREKCGSFSSPKSRGEYLGTIRKKLRNGFLFDNASQIFSNNDGLLFESGGDVSGSSVSRIDGDRVFVGKPGEATNIPENAQVWRNKDVKFEADAAHEAKRFRPVEIDVSQKSDSVWIFLMRLTDSDPEISAQAEFKSSQIAENRQSEEKKIFSCLSKLGDTAFFASNSSPHFSAPKLPHIKFSECNALRRKLSDSIIASILKENRISQRRRLPHKISFTSPPFHADARANVLNELARNLYADMGFEISSSAPEKSPASFPKDIPAAASRHCVLREIGMCKAQCQASKKFREPLYLRNGEKKLRLSFDCAKCQMNIFACR